MANSNLHKAKKVKNDEFYTQLSDIEKEMKHYKKHFKDKVIYCNCDASDSNFVKYFTDNFTKLGLKELITSSLDEGVDFRSDEAVRLLKECDIVVTNPPFSLFREYMAQLMEYDKQFLIVGNKNAITYKEIFPLIKDNKVWLGNTSPIDFNQPEGVPKKQMKGLTRWWTNMDFPKRHEKFIGYKTYTPEEYPMYDNYLAINVDKVKDIPIDFKNHIGVPITFLDKHNPNEFEIIKFRKGNDEKDLSINGKCPYFRIIIKRK